jgi:ABC-type sugar transport system permease subunit
MEVGVAQTIARREQPARRRFLALPSSSRMSAARFAYSFAAPVAALLILLNVYPFLYSFWISLNDLDLRLGTSEFTGLGNYVLALSSARVWGAVWVTVLYAVQVTVYSSVLTLAISLLLNEQFRGRTFLVTISILPWAMSTYAAAILWRFLLSKENGLFSALLVTFGLTSEPINLLDINTALSWLALAHAWHIAPLGVYFLLATLQVIPKDLYRVARIDRLRTFGRFQHVTLPYLKAPLLIMLILNTLSAINVFDLIYFTTAGGPGAATRTMTYEIYTQSFVNFRLGLGAAESYLLLIAVIAITVFYVRLLYRRERVRTAEEAA